MTTSFSSPILTRLMPFLAVLILLSWSACGDDDSGARDGGSAAADDEKPEGSKPEEGEDINGEACEHMAEGPAETVAAVLDTEPARDVSKSHVRFDITLADIGGGKGGAVQYAAAEAADYVIFASAEVPLVVFGLDGKPVAIEETTHPGVCAEVPVAYTVEMGVGLHKFVFGPTDAGIVSIVVEEAGGHGEDEHEGEQQDSSK